MAAYECNYCLNMLGAEHNHRYCRPEYVAMVKNNLKNKIDEWVHVSETTANGRYDQEIQHWLENISMQDLRIMAVEEGFIYYSASRAQLITLLKPRYIQLLLRELEYNNRIYYATVNILNKDTAEEITDAIIGAALDTEYTMYDMIRMIKDGLQKDLYNDVNINYDAVMQGLVMAIQYYITHDHEFIHTASPRNGAELADNYEVNEYLRIVLQSLTTDDMIPQPRQQQPPRVQQTPRPQQQVRRHHKIQYCSMGNIEDVTGPNESKFDCCICTETYKSMEKATMNCNHSFCVECIQEYIDVCHSNRDVTCPLCRTKIMNVTLYDVEVHNDFKIKNGL